MILSERSLPEFFEQKYRMHADPWHFASDRYEQKRYESIMAAIRHRRYQRALEPGCSVGVLTEQLAKICDAVEAFDFSPTAAAQARERCKAVSHVDVSCQGLQDYAVPADVDLLLLSEVGYYFTPGDWQQISTRLILKLAPGATVLAAHWLGSSKDHEMSGDQVHSILRATPKLLLEHEERCEGFRIDRMVRV